MTLLPLHAAGRPADPGTPAADSVPDRVISSYTPTLAALARSRQASDRVKAEYLSIGLPATPGLPRLPAVTEELDVLARHLPPGSNYKSLSSAQATREAVRRAMARASWTHLACHAIQQHADPDQTGLALWDGMLTISELAAQPPQKRELAFLSACQTATGSINHLDEAIHLAAAMQYLGYRHVIATMWSTYDMAAAQVASTCYAELTADSPAPDPDRAAEALHRATRSLRSTNPANPLLWAPFVHYGS
jgi:CHAT domain-containing protein